MMHVKWKVAVAARRILYYLKYNHRTSSNRIKTLRDNVKMVVIQNASLVLLLER